MSRRIQPIAVSLLYVAFAAAILASGTVLACQVRAKSHHAAPRPSVSGAQIPSSTCGGWTLVASPNASAGNNVLLGVSADSSADVWAVGDYTPSSSSVTATLTEHYNGAAWSVVSSPNASGGSNQLSGVVALSSANAWAVGYYLPTSSAVPRNLIEHWDGSHWSTVTSPNNGTDINELMSIAAVSATDIWAAGYYYDDTLSKWQTLIERWNGSAWTIVPSPDASLPGPRAGLPGENQLYSIAAGSATDAWAVGEDSGAPLILHWNGTVWTLSSPQATPYGAGLYGVAIASSSEVWAVGQDNLGTLTEQWNGTAWSIVPSINPNGDSRSLFQAVAADTVLHRTLSVGYAAPAIGIPSRSLRSPRPYGGYQPYSTLAEQWNGTDWAVMPTVDTNIYFNVLNSVAVIPSSGYAWAVGDVLNATTNSDQTLIEHYSPTGQTLNPCAQASAVTPALVAESAQ